MHRNLQKTRGRFQAEMGIRKIEKTPAVTALTGFIRPGESRQIQRDKKARWRERA